jgi:hypothetical protein
VQNLFAFFQKNLQKSFASSDNCRTFAAGIAERAPRTSSKNVAVHPRLIACSGQNKHHKKFELWQ